MAEPEQIWTIQKDYQYYTPLDPSREVIPLVVLYPSIVCPEITCGLITVSPHREPPGEYECLSYFWGDLDVTILQHEIEGETEFMHQQYFVVTTNLESAIRHRRYEEVYLVWIDAISISQNDVSERTQRSDP